MTVKLLEPNLIEKYTDAEGRLTLDGIKLFGRMIAMLKDHESRVSSNATAIATNATAIADHEERITALEP